MNRRLVILGCLLVALLATTATAQESDSSSSSSSSSESSSSLSSSKLSSSSESSSKQSSSESKSSSQSTASSEQSSSSSSSSVVVAPSPNPPAPASPSPTTVVVAGGRFFRIFVIRLRRTTARQFATLALTFRVQISTITGIQTLFIVILVVQEIFVPGSHKFTTQDTDLAVTVQIFADSQAAADTAVQTLRDSVNNNGGQLGSFQVVSIEEVEGTPASAALARPSMLVCGVAVLAVLFGLLF